MEAYDYLSPIKLFIVFLIFLLVFLVKSKTYNHNANWARGFGLLIVISMIITLIVLEVILTFFSDSTLGVRLLISLIAIPVSLTLLFKVLKRIK